MAKPKDLKEEITNLLREGRTNSYIATQLGCSLSNITYYRRLMGFTFSRYAQTIDWNKAQEYYDSGQSIKDVARMFGTTSQTVLKYLRTRNRSESAILDQKLRPRKHTAETKEKLRTHMIRRLEEGTYPTLGRSNRKINAPSYPETFFANIIEKYFDNKHVIAEYPCGSYSLDFAWPELKRYIEMDGEQHYATPEAIEHDKKRDAWLTEHGWQGLRIRWKHFKKDPQPFIEMANKFIAR